MSLAQVVYRISTDSDFAARMQADPEIVLAEKGFSLSKEEQAFLARGLARGSQSGNKISMNEVASLYVGWK